jgi:hypothetical protein
MFNFKPPRYRQVLRFNPSSDIEAFKKDMDWSDKASDGRIFDLRGVAVPPGELQKRQNYEVMETSTEARKESKRLTKLYGVDCVEDWCREHWKGITENVTFAMWFDKHTLYVNSEEKLYPVLLYIAEKYKLEFYYSFVEDCDKYFEENCGVSRIGHVNEFLEMGTDKFELFAFGSILIAGQPLSFETWEKDTIPIKNKVRYYEEHFNEENSKKRIKNAFNRSNAVCVANLMVNEELGPERVWDALSKVF